MYKALYIFEGMKSLLRAMIESAPWWNKVPGFWANCPTFFLLSLFFCPLMGPWLVENCSVKWPNKREQEIIIINKYIYSYITLVWSTLQMLSLSLSSKRVRVKKTLKTQIRQDADLNHIMNTNYLLSIDYSENNIGLGYQENKYKIRFIKEIK